MASRFKHSEDPLIGSSSMAATHTCARECQLVEWRRAQVAKWQQDTA